MQPEEGLGQQKKKRNHIMPTRNLTLYTTMEHITRL